MPAVMLEAVCARGLGGLVVRHRPLPWAPARVLTAAPACNDSLPVACQAPAQRDPSAAANDRVRARLDEIRSDF